MLAHHFEEEPHELLALPPVLGGEGRGGHVEESGAALGGHGLGQHSLARPWGANHQHTLPRSSDALKNAIEKHFN